MKKNISGFTIVELLIVVVVIGVLATIAVVAYNGIQLKAQAVQIVSDLKSTEKSLQLYRTTSGASSWWVDTDTALTGSANPTITSIQLAQPGLREWMKNAPAFTNLGGTNWFYDNDNDTYTGCGNATTGVNIALTGSTNTTLMQKIDDISDDGDLNCGRVRIGTGGWFVYTISNSP